MTAKTAPAALIDPEFISHFFLAYWHFELSALTK